MKKRLLSVSLTLAMLLTLLPLGAVAADDGAPHTHEVDGETVTFDHALTAGEENALLVDGVALMPDSEDFLLLDAGSYRMEGDVTLTKVPCIRGSGVSDSVAAVRLCLNGHTLSLDENHYLELRQRTALTISDCGDKGTLHGENNVINCSALPDYPAELTVESGRIISDYGDAITTDYTYVALGDRASVQGASYGVVLNYDGKWTLTKSILTLTGAPQFTGNFRGDIRLRDKSSGRNTIPFIDATAYTGDALTIEFSVIEPGQTLADKVGAPIVKLGDTPASKFSLTGDHEGYRLKKQTVDGVACLVLAQVSNAQAEWGADADNLTEEGTLEEALAAAAANSDTVAYIQLASAVTAADGQTFTASGGTFTLDLNGHTLTGGKGGDSSLAAATGKPALTVAGADVTVTGTGTLQGGQGGTYSDRINMNRGGPGARVNSGKLTVDSDGVAVTIGLPGESCTAAVPANGDCALEITGGEAILKAGTVDVSAKKNTDDQVIQRGGDAISMTGGLLTVPQGSTLQATATGGNSGLGITDATANIAGGAFGGAPFDYIPPDTSAAPQYGIHVSIGTCNISGGSFVGHESGLYWSGSGKCTLSGGYYYNDGSKAVNVSGVTYASLLEEGSSFVYPSENRVLTDEEEIAHTAHLTVVPPAQPHVHAVSVDCSAEHGDQVTFTPWDKTDSLPTDAGNYYLTTDVALSGDWTTPEGTIDLCLNGHTITAPGVAIVSSKETTLNLCDCAETGTISNSGSLSVITLFGALHLYGGTVSGAQVGVLVSENSEFQMHGGSIKNNLEGLGEGVDVGGTFLMDGGAITGNKAGVYVSTGAKFQVKGDVVIADNTLGNVVLDGEGSHMELSGPLGLGAEIGLSVSDWATVTADSPKLAVQGAEGYPTVNAVNYAKLFCDNSKYQLKLDDGKVYFEPAPSFSVRYENGNAVVDAPWTGDYTVVFAAYDADGRLTDLYIAPVSNAPAGKTTFIPNNFTPDATVKVMLLDGLTTLHPLCPAATWTQTR